MGEKTSENKEDQKLREKIKQLKERERRLREERHRLEAQLRDRVFKKFMEMEEKIEG